MLQAKFFFFALITNRIDRLFYTHYKDIHCVTTRLNSSTVLIPVGDQTAGSWERLCQEHSGGEARSGARHHSLRQAQRPGHFPERPLKGRWVPTTLS